MRFFIILIAASLALSACEHAGMSEYASSENVTVSQGTYAVASAAPSGATIKPSNECAESFDDAISYLEYLMKKKQAGTQPQ